MKTMRNWVAKIQPQHGQGMTEYIIIVGVVAVLMIIVVNRYGKELASLFDNSTKQISNTADVVQSADNASNNN